MEAYKNWSGMKSEEERERAEDRKVAAEMAALGYSLEAINEERKRREAARREAAKVLR